MGYLGTTPTSTGTKGCCRHASRYVALWVLVEG